MRFTGITNWLERLEERCAPCPSRSLGNCIVAMAVLGHEYRADNCPRAQEGDSELETYAGLERIEPGYAAAIIHVIGECPIDKQEA